MADSPLVTVALWLFGLALLLFPGDHQRRHALLFRRPAAAASEIPTAADPLAVAGTLDLLAACLRAGLPMAAAAASAADSAPVALRQPLQQAASLLALGADAASAWSASAAANDPAIAAVARLARRSARSGSSLAEAISGLAARCRQDAGDAAAARAERAGVLISGPLGLCFLPAFICLGIVPVVLGLASRVLGGGGLT